ncbi:hypothetical protein NM208_g16512 [Fusarium decemcellulare]|uniref:Uncharacterized protein n=1 Tax=Fusarium decemcellulare TaxID=57161 RepID=A0ACC1RA37_9HYPO|nr:hypothetical protein NM208_g16512 [Fusarium decemcellulare]
MGDRLRLRLSLKLKGPGADSNPTLFNNMNSNARRNQKHQQGQNSRMPSSSLVIVTAAEFVLTPTLSFRLHPVRDAKTREGNCGSHRSTGCARDLARPKGINKLDFARDESIAGARIRQGFFPQVT